MSIFNIFKRKKTAKRGDFYKTTDSFLRGKENVGKKRTVVVYDKRKDDGALAVSKIYSKKNKNKKNLIDDLTLTPKKHKSLTEDSAIGTRVVWGTKNGKDFKPIYSSDMQKVNDKLTRSERKKYIKNAGGKEEKHKQTLRTTTDKWKKHFKE